MVPSQGRGIEAVVVDDVVIAGFDRFEDVIERVGNSLQSRSWAAGAVKRRRQCAGVDAGVHDARSVDARSRGRIDVDDVATLRQPRGQVGDQGLRSAALRLGDRSDEWGNERDLEGAIRHLSMVDR